MTDLFQDDDDNLQIDENKDYYGELVGEGKKYKDNEALAKKAIHADIHITNLERRLDQMREDYTKLLDESKARPKLEELIDKLTSGQQLTSRDDTHNSNEDNNRPTTPDQIQSLVSSEIQRIFSTQKEQENYNLVQAKLRESFGNNYKTALKEQAEQLGLTDDEVNSMAKRNPKLFFKTFDVSPQAGESFQAPPSSSRRNDSFAPRTVKRTMSYYENMRKTNPRLYFDPKIAVQMDKDAQELGASFFDI